MNDVPAYSNSPSSGKAGEVLSATDRPKNDPQMATPASAAPLLAILDLHDHPVTGPAEEESMMTNPYRFIESLLDGAGCDVEQAYQRVDAMIRDPQQRNTVDDLARWFIKEHLQDLWTLRHHPDDVFNELLPMLEESMRRRAEVSKGDGGLTPRSSRAVLRRVY